jgi:YQGE family putative transporter
MTALFVFGIAVALFYPLYSIPMTSRVFDLIGQNEDGARNRVEYVVTREIALDVGRIIGVAVFLVVVSINQTPAALNWLMLAVGSSPLFAWIWMKKLFG